MHARLSHALAVAQDGEELVHYQMECQADGNWSRSIPVCRSKQVYLNKVVYSSRSQELKLLIYKV